MTADETLPTPSTSVGVDAILDNVMDVTFVHGAYTSWLQCGAAPQANVLDHIPHSSSNVGWNVGASDEM